MPRSPSRVTTRRALGALALALCLALGGSEPAAAQEIPVVRPADARPEQRIDVNGSLVAVTHVEDARQADAVFLQGQRERYERAATDPLARPYGLFLTSDMDGRPSFIVLDLSWLAEEDDLQYVNLLQFRPGTTAVRGVPGTHESIQVLLHPQPDGTYLAREYRELTKGSMVNNTDWGVSESYTTRDDSINARVGNVPDDDEALSQGNRFDSKGRRVEDDDD